MGPATPIFTDSSFLAQPGSAEVNNVRKIIASIGPVDLVFIRKCPCHFAVILSAAKNLINPVHQTLRLRLRVTCWTFMFLCELLSHVRFIRKCSLSPIYRALCNYFHAPLCPGGAWMFIRKSVTKSPPAPLF